LFRPLSPNRRQKEATWRIVLMSKSRCLTRLVCKTATGWRVDIHNSLRISVPEAGSSPTVASPQTKTIILECATWPTKKCSLVRGGDSFSSFEQNMLLLGVYSQFQVAWEWEAPQPSPQTERTSRTTNSFNDELRNNHNLPIAIDISDCVTKLVL